MLFTSRAYNGMVITPHRLASQAGAAVLRKGGNAVEAAVAAAAALCVVYPHMTGLGGDGVWLILPATSKEQGQPPFVIDACGRSALLASRGWYGDRGFSRLPATGPEAAVTMAGALSGWQAALEEASSWPRREGGPLGLADFLEDAVALAEQGYPVSTGQSALAFDATDKPACFHDFARVYLVNGHSPGKGRRLRLPELAKTLRRLAADGLDSFYRGALAAEMAAALEAAGSPLRLEDFTAYRAVRRKALRVNCFGATLYNSPPPTQGLASLMILALMERLIASRRCAPRDEASLVHSVVEATKTAFLLRDKHIGDPDHMVVDPGSLLEDRLLDSLAQDISPDAARPWPFKSAPGGDTVWIGAMDRMGNSVSCIQSLYHEFGSGLVLPGSGVLWHNRGLGFVFEEGHVNSLAPGKQPFHTLNPAMALFADGREMAYGSMGGDGQPQTQAALFLRYAELGFPLQASISKARWLLGRSWGAASSTLKLERNAPPEVFRHLRALGHEVEVVGDYSSLMGHAGALVRYNDGLIEGAFDPRGDGAAGCW